MSKSISPQIACVLAFKHSQIENFHQKCSQCSWPNHALDLPIFSTVKGTHRLHQNHYPTNPTILPTLPPYHHPAIKFLSPIKRSTTYFFLLNIAINIYIHIFYILEYKSYLHCVFPQFQGLAVLIVAASFLKEYCLGATKPCKHCKTLQNYTHHGKHYKTLLINVRKKLPSIAHNCKTLDKRSNT